MKKINLAITGCMGRMGQQIIKSVRKDKNFKIVALTESKEIDKKIYGIKINLNTEEVFKKVDLIIDFTTPKCTFQILNIASKLKGKHKVEYTPHVDTGDYVVVINAEKVRVTGNKLKDKKYHRYTGYIGNLRR